MKAFLLWCGLWRKKSVPSLRMYRVQRNALGELRVQWRVGRFGNWSTLYRKDGRGEGQPAITTNLAEAFEIMEDDRKHRLQLCKRATWETVMEDE